jgi:hypothetical protein
LTKATYATKQNSLSGVGEKKGGCSEVIITWQGRRRSGIVDAGCVGDRREKRKSQMKQKRGEVREKRA